MLMARVRTFADGFQPANFTMLSTLPRHGLTGESLENALNARGLLKSLRL